MELNSKQREFLEQYYNEMFSLLRRYALTILHNEAQAEEAVQDTFRIACMKVEHVLSSQNPRGWLMNTLKFVIHDMQRSKASYDRLMLTLFSTMPPSLHASVIDLSDRVDLLYADIAEDKDFGILYRLHVDGCSMLQVSQEYNITLEACKKRAQRARARLRKKLEQEK